MTQTRPSAVNAYIRGIRDIRIEVIIVPQNFYGQRSGQRGRIGKAIPD